MIAVYSIWNMDDEHHHAGFNSEKDLMSCMKLSMLQAQKFFDRVILITDSINGRRAAKYQLPCDEIRIEFDHLPYDRSLWAITKLLALKSVYQPDMVHIDNDFIFWQDPASLWTGDMLFQSYEHYDNHPDYVWRGQHICEWYPDIYKRSLVHADYAFNCGVIGMRDPAIIDRWLMRVYMLINQEGVIENWPRWKPGINFMFEQAFISNICEQYGLKADVLISGTYRFDISPVFTHIWGQEKRKKDNMTPLYTKLAVAEKYYKPKKAA